MIIKKTLENGEVVEVEVTEAERLEAEKLANEKAEIDKLEAEKNNTGRSIDRFSPEAQDYIKSLRGEGKEARLKLKEIEEKIEADKKAKLIEDGKLQEVIDSQSKELDSLNVMKTENETNKEYFEKVLSAEVEGLSDSIKEMIMSSGKMVLEKIEQAKKIKAEQGLSTNSVGSEMIGKGSNGTVTSDAILQEYRDLKTVKERQSFILKLKSSDSKAFETLKKQIA